MLKSLIKVIFKYPIKLVNYIYTFFYYKSNTINLKYKIDDMIGKKDKIIVFSPHVDDETIGLGGTLLKYKEQGNEMTLVYLTDGGGSTSNLSREEVVNQRKKEGEKVKNIYGFKKVYFLDELDGEVDSTNTNLIEKIVDILVEEEPGIIYTPFLLDGHKDHVETTRSIMKSLRIWDKNFNNIYMYEVNCPIDPKLINSVSPMDEDLYEQKGRVYNIFSSQSVMGFSVFRLLDRRKSLLIKNEYGAEIFVKVDLSNLLEIEDILVEQGFQPQQFRQLSSEYNLLLAFGTNKKLKEVYSNHISKKVYSKDMSKVDL